MQAAYEELTERGADAFTRLFRQHPAAAWADAARQRAAQQTAWRESHAWQRQRIHIESAAEELDSSAFARRVLAADHRPGGRPWVVQLYAHDSPFRRALVRAAGSSGRHSGPVCVAARVACGTVELGGASPDSSLVTRLPQRPLSCSPPSRLAAAAGPSYPLQSSQWEAALRGAGSLLSFGRINLQEQPMLVGADGFLFVAPVHCASLVRHGCSRDSFLSLDMMVACLACRHAAAR